MFHDKALVYISKFIKFVCLAVRNEFLNLCFFYNLFVTWMKVFACNRNDDVHLLLLLLNNLFNLDPLKWWQQPCEMKLDNNFGMKFKRQDCELSLTWFESWFLFIILIDISIFLWSNNEWLVELRIDIHFYRLHL